MSRWTLADVRAVQARHAESAPSDRKYKNKIVVIDNITFDSKKEGDHYLLLKMRERMGEISNLDVHPVFPLYVDKPDGRRIHGPVFKADFRYTEHYCGKEIERVVDVKSPVSRTEAYQLRKWFFEQLYMPLIEV
jgi:Protein of unknown function (DUF1064)